MPLAISRKPGESVYLTISPEDLRQLADEGQELEITLYVTRFDGKKSVKFGIDSDLRVKVLRSELKWRKANQQ